MFTGLRHPKLQSAIFTLSILSASAVSANVPSAYFACEGAEPGDSCQLPGPQYGSCILDTRCEDPKNTTVNECLLCVDGCWGHAPDSFCVQRDGSDGVCRQQSQCTTDPEKSFDQCNWCVSGDVTRQAAEDGGCQQIRSFVFIPWFLLGLIAFYQLKNRKRPKAPNP